MGLSWQRSGARVPRATRSGRDSAGVTTPTASPLWAANPPAEPLGVLGHGQRSCRRSEVSNVKVQ